MTFPKVGSGALFGALLISLALLTAPHGLAQGNPAVVGQWSDVEPWPVVSVHTHLLHTGQILFWADDDAQGFYQWDPVTSSIIGAETPALNVFCSGHSFLADGRLIAAGGHLRKSRGPGHREHL